MLKNTTKPDEVASTVRDWVITGVAQMSEWARIALKARRYYHSEQWDDADASTRHSRKRRLRMTNNIIRRDIDHIKGGLMEADPIMHTQGRGPEDFHLGETWRDLIDYADDWHGMEFDSAKETREDCISDCVEIGEGVEKIGWSKDEEEGLGMVVSEWKDPTHMVWDTQGRGRQRRRARWMGEFEPLPIELLEQEFPKLKDKISDDVPSLFQDAYRESRYEQYRSLLRPNSQAEVPSATKEKKAYRIEMWEKRLKYKTRYFLRDLPARVESEDGRMVPMTEDDFSQLPETEQELYDGVRSRHWELWVHVVINKHLAKSEISIFDESRGGHGEYPYAFYSDVRDVNQSHAHGEIEYLMGHQDVVNHATTRWLEAMLIANSQFLAVQKGSMPKGDEGKLDQLGKDPLQKVFYYPGQPIPQFVGSSPAAGQVFMSGIQMLTQQKDQQSGVQDVNRNAPQYELSGRAVRALQADADLMMTLPRKAVESGLRQAYYLRIAVMQQFMRASRMIRITPKAENQDPYKLFVGRSESGLQQKFGLTAQQKPQEQDLPREMEYRSPQGEPAKTLVINDESVRKFDLKLTLDTGAARKHEEQTEVALSFLQYLGPLAGIGVLKWIGSIMEVPNKDELFTALEEEDGKNKVVQQVQQAEKETGMDFQEMVSMAAGMGQKRSA